MYNSANVSFVSEQILHNIKQEYKRLQKRRHLDSAFQQVDGCCPLDLQSIHNGSVHPGNANYPGKRCQSTSYLSDIMNNSGLPSQNQECGSCNGHLITRWHQCNFCKLTIAHVFKTSSCLEWLHKNTTVLFNLTVTYHQASLMSISLHWLLYFSFLMFELHNLGALGIPRALAKPHKWRIVDMEKSLRLSLSFIKLSLLLFSFVESWAEHVHTVHTGFSGKALQWPLCRVFYV